MSVTEIDWAKFVRELKKDQKKAAEEGITGKELASLMGCSERSACSMVRAGLERGKLERVTVYRQAITGVISPRTGFRPTRGSS